MDVTSISSAISALSTAVDLAKYVMKTFDSLEKAEVRSKLAELMVALSEAKLELAGVRETLVEKDAEIRALNERLTANAKLRYEAPYYCSGDGVEREGPFCQRCYDVERKMVRLQAIEPKRWICRACNGVCNDSDYRPSKPPRIRRRIDPYGEGF